MTTVVDDFNRADSGTLGANYATAPSGGSLGIVSNQASGTASESRGNLRTAESFGNDQYVEFAVGALSGTYYSAYLRCAGSGATLDGYELTVGAITGVYITVLTDGSGTDIYDTSVGTDHQAGDAFRMEVVGTTLKIFRNSSEIASVSDSTYSSGAPGLKIYNNGTINSATFGDTGGAPSIAPFSARRRGAILRA